MDFQGLCGDVIDGGFIRFVSLRLMFQLILLRISICHRKSLTIRKANHRAEGLWSLALQRPPYSNI